MESFVYDISLVHLVINRFMNVEMHGSLPKKTSLMNTLWAQHDISILIDTMQGVEIVFLVLSETIEVVNHRLLVVFHILYK